MAFDAARGRTVLFGGLSYPDSRSGGVPLQFDDTWEWDGSEWCHITRRGGAPSAIAFAAMTYDPLRRRTVLYGGITFNGSGVSHRNETWEWDGAAWAQRTVATAPAGRAGATMAFDPVRQRVLMFGGRRFGPLTYNAELWELSDTGWVRIPTVSGPSARSGAVMALDPLRRRIVLFGGTDANGPLDDTWEWDGAAWQQVSGPGPSPRSEASMTFEPEAGHLLLTCGVAGQNRLNDTWAFDGATWERLSTTGPLPRGRSAMAVDASGQPMLFAGVGTVPFADLWRWNGAAWEQVQADSPPGRAFAAMSLDTLRDEAVLFGGMVNDGTGQLFRDTWVFNGKSWRLASESGPSPRQSHAIAFDTQRGVAVLFGGSDFHGSQSPQDTWEWNGASWSVRATAGPGPRSGAAMVYDAARRQTLLYGGATAGSYRDDTWAWDGVQWRALAASGPGPRVGAAMVYDAARERVVLFGGLAGISSSPPPPGDTWEWDGTAWSQVATSGPTGRVYPGLAFVAGANRTVLFGGGNGAGLSDAWTWDGSSWTPLTGSAPPGRTAFAMGASPTGGRALVFGGWVPTVSNSAFDTWELRVPFCRADADCSGDVAVADVFGYLGTWFAGSPPADFDGSGRVDLSDLFTFLGAWFDGCS